MTASPPPPAKPLAVLAGARVVLRPLEAADLPRTLAWRNAHRRWFIHDALVSEEQHRAWFARYAANSHDIVFVIDERHRLHRPVGQVALYGIDRPARRAECGRLVVGDPEARGAGLAAEAIGLVVAWAFGPLGLSEVVAEIFEHNVASRRSFERAGFVWRAQDDRLVTYVATAPTAGPHAGR